MKDLAQHLRENLGAFLLVCAIALVIVAIFKAGSWGSDEGISLVAGPVDRLTEIAR